MTMEASGVLGTVKKVLESGPVQDGASIATAPLPSITGGGGVPAGDGSLWISQVGLARDSGRGLAVHQVPLVAEEQASLAVEGGYAPIRSDATKVPALAAEVGGGADLSGSPTTSSRPARRTPQPRARSSATTKASRDAVKDGMLSMLTGGLSPAAGLQKAQSEADAAIKAYNDRLGVS